jgi:hypothetical protein
MTVTVTALGLFAVYLLVAFVVRTSPVAGDKRTLMPAICALNRRVLSQPFGAVSGQCTDHGLHT